MFPTLELCPRGPQAHCDLSARTHLDRKLPNHNLTSRPQFPVALRDPGAVAGWSDDEVARRWITVYRPSCLDVNNPVPFRTGATTSTNTTPARPVLPQTPNT